MLEPLFVIDKVISRKGSNEFSENLFENPQRLNANLLLINYKY